jgi:hypothetical protein
MLVVFVSERVQDPHVLEAHSVVEKGNGELKPFYTIY